MVSVLWLPFCFYMCNLFFLFSLFPSSLLPSLPSTQQEPTSLAQGCCLLPENNHLLLFFCNRTCMCVCKTTTQKNLEYGKMDRGLSLVSLFLCVLSLFLLLWNLGRFLSLASFLYMWDFCVLLSLL